MVRVVCTLVPHYFVLRVVALLAVVYLVLPTVGIVIVTLVINIIHSRRLSMTR